MGYAARGWSVFPCLPQDKRPAIRSWTNGATGSSVTIERWWQANPRLNVAVVTGELVVIDVDDLSAVGQLIRAGYELPPTLSSITGSGGAHYWYVQTDHGLRNHAGRLPGVGSIPGIDLRGWGGYIIAPPSIHPDGGRYEWLHEKGDWPTDPAPIPHWLRNPPVVDYSGIKLEDVSDAYLQAALNGEVEKLAASREPGRNDQLNRSAFALGQLIRLGLDPEVAYRNLLLTAVRVGLGETESRKTIKSGFDAGWEQPRAS